MSSGPTPPHADLATPTAAAAVVGERPGRVLLLARGRIRAHPPSALEHVFDVQDPPVLLFRGWLALGDRDLLAQRLNAGEVRVGGLEPGSYWWTADGGPFRLWDPEGLLWVQRSDRLERSRPRTSLALAQILAVEAYVGSDWVEQGVRLRLVGGGTLGLARVMNTSARDNMEYDGLSLDYDTSWCRQVARALADRVSVPFEDATA
jgi:hypothetical protein